MTHENGDARTETTGRGGSRNTLTFRDKQDFLTWCRKRAIRPNLATLTAEEIREHYRRQTEKTAPPVAFIKNELATEGIAFRAVRTRTPSRSGESIDERRAIVLAKGLRLVMRSLKTDYGPGETRDALNAFEVALTSIVGRQSIEAVEASIG